MGVARRKQVVAGSKLLAMVVVSVWLAAGFVYFGYGESIVEAAYQGRSFSALNRVIEHQRRARPESRNLEYFQHKRTTAFVELCLGFSVIEGVLLLVAFRRTFVNRLIKAGQRFFLRPEYPFNIALFRVIFFLFLAWCFNGNAVVWFHRLPRELEVAPFGFGWALPILASVTPKAIESLAHLLPIVCLTAAIGCFARSSALLAALLGFILMGIPQSFGKINHMHILVWVALLLAASRSADVLSVDALVRAVRSPTRKITTRSSAYGLPLRLIWIILGVGYFFAGMWKLIDGRWEWIFSDNLRNWVFTRALEKHTVPYLAMNVPSWFFHLAALFVIVFELSFIVLILFRSGRAIAVLLGLLFHNGVGVFFGNASFLQMQICYFALIDWQSAIRWWQRRFARPTYVRYDHDCIVCRRAVCCAVTLGCPNAIPYGETPSELHVSRTAFIGPGTVADLHINHSSAPTVRSYCRVCHSLATRVPLIWLAYPILLGSHIFDMLRLPATNTTVHGASRSAGRLPTRKLIVAAKAFDRLYLVGLVGVVIVGTNTVFAIFHLPGWPFTGFPSFNHIATERITLFRIERVDEAGNTASLDPASALKVPDIFRAQAICDNIYRHPEKPEIGTAFCKVLRESMPDYDSSFAIRIYAEENSILPGESGKNPLARRLVFECK